MRAHLLKVQLCLPWVRAQLAKKKGVVVLCSAILLFVMLTQVSTLILPGQQTFGASVNQAKTPPGVDPKVADLLKVSELERKILLMEERAKKDKSEKWARALQRAAAVNEKTLSQANANAQLLSLRKSPEGNRAELAAALKRAEELEETVEMMEEDANDLQAESEELQSREQDAFAYADPEQQKSKAPPGSTEGAFGPTVERLTELQGHLDMLHEEAQEAESEFEQMERSHAKAVGEMEKDLRKLKALMEAAIKSSAAAGVALAAAVGRVAELENKEMILEEQLSEAKEMFKVDEEASQIEAIQLANEEGTGHSSTTSKQATKQATKPPSPQIEPDDIKERCLASSKANKNVLRSCNGSPGKWFFNRSSNPSYSFDSRSCVHDDQTCKQNLGAFEPIYICPKGNGAERFEWRMDRQQCASGFRHEEIITAFKDRVVCFYGDSMTMLQAATLKAEMLGKGDDRLTKHSLFQEKYGRTKVVMVKEPLLFHFNGSMSNAYRKEWVLNLNQFDARAYSLLPTCDVIVLNSALFWQSESIGQVKGIAGLEGMKPPKLYSGRAPRFVYQKGVEALFRVFNKCIPTKGGFPGCKPTAQVFWRTDPFPDKYFSSLAHSELLQKLHDKFPRVRILNTTAISSHTDPGVNAQTICHVLGKRASRRTGRVVCDKLHFCIGSSILKVWSLALAREICGKFVHGV